MRGYFVTGTDTGVGKTLIACALLHRFRAQGLTAVGMKPVAAGCQLTPDGLINEDVEALRVASSIELAREAINCYAFEAPIAPHIAAASAGVEIDLVRIEERFKQLAAIVDVVIVEGAGGFLVPLSEQESFADLAVRLGLPVILVVGMRLGCVNHALLSAEAIRNRGLPLAGWIANCIDPSMRCLEENLASLRSMIQARNLGVVRFQPSAQPDRIELELPSYG